MIEAADMTPYLLRRAGVGLLRVVLRLLPVLPVKPHDEIAILGLGRCRLQTEDVATRMRFGDLYSTPDHPSIKTRRPFGK